MTRMSVLYLIDSLAPGGAERSLVDMAPHLVEAGVDLTVAVLHERPGLQHELTHQGIPVRLVEGRDRVSWLRGAASLVRAERPDLLHTTLFDADLVGRTAGFWRRVPVVTTLANTPYGPEHRAEVSRLKLRAAQAADIATARLVRRFHAVSQATADACVSRLHVRPGRIDVIPRGRDRARLGQPSAMRRKEVRNRLGIDADAPVVLAVARQEPQKGLDVLLRALPPVLAAVSDLTVLIAGGAGRASAELQRLHTALGQADRVRFLGGRDDVPDLLCAADALVLPSHREGLPGAVLEAMAMGAPVVASDLPMVREAVPDSRFALLVPAGDPLALGEALQATLADPRRALARAAAARLRFEECFGIEGVSQKMVGFYRRALHP